MPAYEVKTDGRSRTDILTEYINSSVYLPYDEYASQFASQEAFDTFLIPDDINRRINNGGILMTPIEYIIYSALRRHTYKHIPGTRAGAEAPGLEGVYRLIDLFIKRGAKFSYDRRKFNDLLTPEVTKYFDTRKEVEEYNSALRQMDDYYRSRLPASSTSAAAETRPASETVPVVGKTGCFGVGCSRKRSNRRRSTHRNRRNRSRKH